MSHRRFVIPDIHGCALSFAALLHDVLRVQQGDTVYLLGDYIDRGPRSKEVLDNILFLQNRGFSVQPLRGNHDDMFLRACGSLDHLRLWLLNGGRTTLASFNREDPCEIPISYRRFIHDLPYFYSLDDFILVHAGLNFERDDPFDDREAMLWTRLREVDTKKTSGKKIISGHTPVSRETIKRSISTSHILLDNGCVYSGKAELGTLAALELNSLSLFFQKNIE